MSNKILAVIRESTDRQEIDSQKREMREFCLSKGFAEKDIVYIESAGASARKANRRYLDMLDNIKSTLLSDPEMNTCAFWHLNRLGRRKEYISAMEAWFVENRIQVYVKEPSITLLNDKGEEDANASISFSVFAAMVELDTKEMFAKMKRGQKEAQLKGKWHGGKYVRYGYRVDKAGYLVPEKEEADIINMIFRMYATGEWSTVKLARELDARGITLRGAKITIQVLYRLFSDEAYIGEKDGVNYEGIVDKALWNKVRQVAEGNIVKSHDKTTKHNDVFAIRILKCAYCGHNYCYSQGKYMCYSVRSKSRMLNPEEACHEGPHINAKIMDDMLWTVATMCHIEASVQLKKESLKDKEAEFTILRQKVSRLRERLDLCTERLRRNADLYVDGDITKPIFERNKANITADRDSIKKELSKYEKDGQRLSVTIQNIKESTKTTDYYVNVMEELMNIDDPLRKKELVHRYITYATVKKDEAEDAEVKQVLIYIKDINNKEYQFKFCPYAKKADNRVFILQDGKWMPHTITHTRA